ncbi:MAG: hypothetical protein JO268_17220 [Pseudonocardiales bacterium]|nr:hypothetical protein [Pseudonocardiales bacterium]
MTSTVRRPPVPTPSAAKRSILINGGYLLWLRCLRLSDEGHPDMSSNNQTTEFNLTTELREKVRASIHTVVSSGRTFLGEVTGWGGGVSGALLTLAVLTILILIGGDPTPTPTPLPF